MWCVCFNCELRFILYSFFFLFVLRSKLVELKLVGSRALVVENVEMRVDKGSWLVGWLVEEEEKVNGTGCSEWNWGMKGGGEWKEEIGWIG